MLGGELLALNRHFDGVYFRLAASLRVQKYRLCRDSHGNRPIDLFEKVVDYCG